MIVNYEGIVVAEKTAGNKAGETYLEFTLVGNSMTVKYRCPGSENSFYLGNWFSISRKVLEKRLLSNSADLPPYVQRIIRNVHTWYSGRLLLDMRADAPVGTSFFETKETPPDSVVLQKMRDMLNKAHMPRLSIVEMGRVFRSFYGDPAALESKLYFPPETPSKIELDLIEYTSGEAQNIAFKDDSSGVTGSISIPSTLKKGQTITVRMTLL